MNIRWRWYSVEEARSRVWASSSTADTHTLNKHRPHLCPIDTQQSVHDGNMLKR